MKGYIYKIVMENEVYIGSTKRNISTRQAEHNYRLRHPSTKTNSKLYTHFRHNQQSIKCVWVADVEYNSTPELRVVEETYRHSLNATLNGQRSYKSKQDFINDEKCRVRDWKLDWLRRKSKRTWVKYFVVLFLLRNWKNKMF